MKRYIKFISIFALIFSLCLLSINFNVKADDSHSHSYNNGICECGEYEEPVWKQHYPVGWEVGNAGQLLYVIEKHNSGELNNNIILTNDITLPEDFEFVSLGTAEYPFTKSILTINDNVYTINLNNQVVTSSNYGFIGYAKGEEANKALIENINDIAGLRIVCVSEKDVYGIVKRICNLDEINIIKKKDYIKKPKESGYSAYHIIAEVPVYLEDKKVWIKVELQIRTMAMDFWANLEHGVKYKSSLTISKRESALLKIYAKIISKINNSIVRMYKKNYQYIESKI